MKTKPMTVILISLALLLGWSCGTDGASREQTEPVKAVETSDSTSRPAFHFRYDLGMPDQTWDMPDELEEISALSPSADGKQLIAVEDESGTVYFLNKSTGKIENQIEFWKDGDYEGVEVVGEDVFAVKSSGTVYRIRGKRKEDLKVEKFNGHMLGAANDVEGLAYDPVRKQLLLACKGQAGAGSGSSYKKAIYAFDLQRMELDSVPAYLISLDEVQAFLKVRPAIRKIEKLIEHFNTSDSAFVFGPSGIAVHPQTGHLYILSSVGKLLMVLDRSGTILHIEKLDKDVHIQPEGICFDADGTMYISNEGRKDEALIHRFRYQAN